MTTLKFKCTLLSDVILNQKAATEGPNKTLDFIPGSCFLGIAAAKLYPKLDSSTSWEIFHSGKVRFGDAHPSAGRVRGLKAPLSMYSPKLPKPGHNTYIHHRTDNETIRKESLKQIREGFYSFDDGTATRIKTNTNYSIKSAYDRSSRKSKDEQMFGYESLAKGLVLYFEVMVENDKLIGKIMDALLGNRNVGRSRTAQFGLVNIEEAEYQDVPSIAGMSDIVEVYADSRLIFLDEFGIPKFRPTASDLGLEGEVDWNMTQMRTFQYAPWNSKRGGFDADRCGIEKGSVIVVRQDGQSMHGLKSGYVGAYQNEGFGKIIYNPCFLAAAEDGKACCLFAEGDECERDTNDVPVPDTVLLKYLSSVSQNEDDAAKVYDLVNRWVEDGMMKFRSASFASQWGNIRDLAQQTYLFEELKRDINAYLTHGVASARWKERGRLDWLNRFLDSEEINDLPDRFAIMAVINMASEMAKKIQEK